MEKHRCKLCFKNFSNGRALGGHMRSHMLNLPIPPRHEEEEEERPSEPNQLSDGDTESGSLSSSSSSDEEGEEEGGEGEKGNLCYGLRENPKRSFRLVDPEFSFAAAAAAAAAVAVDAGSVVLQDRESETESSKNPTRRRSKRTRKPDHHHHHQFHHHHHQFHQQQQENGTKKLKFHKLSKTTESSSWAHEPEPVSSISDTTTEEDVAFCLMMLSRDKWKRKEQQLLQQQQQQQQQQRRRQVLVVDQEEEEEEAEAEKSMEETDESDEFIKSCKNRSRVSKYKCDTCKKVFKSYQALGGHRASHKKIKFYNTTTATQTTKQTESEQQENAGTSIATPMLEKTSKVHECPVCFRVFSSGQALGGHKRTHVTGLVASTTTPARTQHHQHQVTSSSTKFGDNLIDLNLPAPVDDDDISQIELSAVSDAEFVNHIKR